LNINIIFDGILLGLTLTILLGPIFIALTQTGIQYGARAGISVGTGIWVSDILVIVAAYYFIKQIDAISHSDSFHFWMGLAGGIALIIFGIVAIAKKNDQQQQIPAFNAKSYFGFWTKGFVVNFFNPFTFVFWIGVMSSYVIGKKISGIETIFLFGSIMLTIMITDSSKVLLARYIRSSLTPYHVTLISKVAGSMLVGFGIYLMVRANVF
jgi:threonine/homoserine/homoserine lactone efflux protein